MEGAGGASGVGDGGRGKRRSRLASRGEDCYLPLMAKKEVRKVQQDCTHDVGPGGLNAGTE